MGGFGPYIVMELPFGIPLSQTVVTSWFLMAIIMILTFLGTRNLQMIPGRGQIVVETVVGGINNLTKQTMGEKNAHFAPYIGTLIIFIAFSNLSGLVGLRPPTADINTTLGLALITFFMIQGFSIYSKGIIGYIKSFFQPIVFMAPLNVIGELATPISLSFRLFGNITGGLIMMSLLYSALGYATEVVLHIPIPILQVGIPAFLHIYFDLFAGLIQSFIFSMLTMVFVANALD